MPTPVLEAPAKVEETRSDERGRSEETESTPGWSPLLGAIAAADPLARPVTLGTGLETKSEVLLQLQRTVGNTATCDWIERTSAPPVTVSRACCDGCASGGTCSTGATSSAERDEPEAPPVQRAPLTPAPPVAVARSVLDDTAVNAASRAWLASPAAPTVAVSRACCDGCAAGGPCSTGTTKEPDRDDATTAPVQRTAPPGGVPVVQRGLADDAAGMLAGVRSRAASFVSSIRAAVGRVWDRVQAFARQVGTRLQQAAAAVLQVLSSLFSGLRQRLQAVLERVRAAANSAVDRLLQGVTRLTELARDGWEALKAGARAFLERVRAVANGVVERFKGMGRNAFGPMTGSCLDTPTAEATRSRLEGLAGPGETEVGEAATTGLADLTSQFSNRDAQGNAQLGGLESSASTSIAQTAQENDGLAAAADAGQIDLETRAGTSITDVDNQATTDVSGAEREAESGAGDVDRQRTDGAGGLRGMLGSLVAAISGTAGSVVSGADHDAGEAAGGLRGRFSGLLGSLREVASSALAGLRIGVTQVIDGIKSFARSLAEQARSLWQSLRDTWERLKERGRAAWAQLRQWWDQLSAKATSGWRSLRDFLTRTRNRAALALFNTCGDACALTSAKQDGRQLDAVEVPAISFKARRGGARQPAPSELVAIQASLEDGGQPIPASSRIGLEAAFGTDLTSTRVHTGATAASLASGMNARAFTIGDDIAFGHGEFQPGSLEGDALIAHEVAHVLQQRTSPDGPAAATNGEEAAEHDADQAAVSVVARMWGGMQSGAADLVTNAGPRVRSGLALRRCPSGKCCDPKPAAGALAPELAQGNIDNPRAENLMAGRRGDAEGGDVYGQTGPGFVNALRDMTNAKSSVSEKCSQTCKPNVGSFPTFSLSPFFFVTAGRYEDFDFNPNTGGAGARRFAVAKTGPCKGKSRPRVTIVTDALAAKVKAAEVEHAHDLARAWDLSVAKYIAAVRELEGGFCVSGEEELSGNKCTEEFRKRVGERSGIKWESWSSVAECLANQSKDRDDRKWHTVSDKTGTKVGSKDCKEVEVTPDAAVLTNIGNHSSKEIVDDNAAACGAGGGP